MKYRVRHLTKYSYTDTVPVCHNLVHLAPRALPNQACNYFELAVRPAPSELARHKDVFGNCVDYFAIQDPHRTLCVTAVSEVNVTPNAELDREVSWETLVSDVRRGCLSTHSCLPTHSCAPTEGGLPNLLDAYQYTFPSKYVQTDDALADYAKASFRPGRSLIDATISLTRRINEEFEFDPRATTLSTPVVEVFRRRAGVCQDFAHLQIACLRSIGVPARYVSGYLRTVPPIGQPKLVGVDASHAWLSVFCGEAGWIAVDPTNNLVPEVDHITIAWGRDYQDVCPVQGVFIGGGRHSLTISVDVEPL